MPMLTALTEQQQAYKFYTFQVIKNDTTIVHMHTLLINPEEFTQDEAARNEIIRTIGGAYIEEWGRDLIPFSIKGTPGYKKRIGHDGKETDGFQSFKDLRDNIYRYFLEPDGTLKQKRLDKDTFELRFFNWEDGEYYAIMPHKFTLVRSKSRPLLYAYDFTFTGYRPILIQNTGIAGMLVGGMTGGAPKTQDAVINSVYNFDTVVNNAMDSLVTATNNLEMLMIDPMILSEGAAVSPLDADSYLTELNYPGISNHMYSINAIKNHAVATRAALLKYTKRETTIVALYTTDLRNFDSVIQRLCSGLNELDNIPFEAATALRSIGMQYSLLSNFPQYFKDNNSVISGVSSND